MVKQDASSKVDIYISKAQPFAQQILNHIRGLVHDACPEVEEAIKWGQPFFVYRGAILCHMAGFKAHCRLHFWGKEISAVLRESGYTGESEHAALGDIKELGDLPSNKKLMSLLRQAVKFIDTGEYTSPMTGRTRKPRKASVQPEMPASFAAALRQNREAAGRFAIMSLSCQREYIEWIAEAKRTETSEKRILQALEWIGEGKQRNWKYQSSGK